MKSEKNQTQIKDYRNAYSEYYPLIYSILYTKTGNTHDAEDICQEVFIKFLKNFDSIDIIFIISPKF